ncbi:MAG: alkaline phosphatase family protein, partial [Chloroflexota bacterium]
MSSKVILLLSDALRYDAATAGMGYLGHLVETKQASLYKIVGELPSMSRPMYETIHTGLPSSAHGVVANSIVRLSTQPNLFRLARDAGRATAAAAYYWFSELYNRAPYDPINDRETDDASLPIQHGRFYTEDEYPDKELFATAGLLVRRFAPDYLLIHPM